MLSTSALDDFPESSRQAQDATDYDSVVVGLAPEAFDYKTMNTAFRLLLEDGSRPLIVTHKARYYKEDDDRFSLGPGLFRFSWYACHRAQCTVVAGPFISALEEATDVEAQIGQWNLLAAG